MVLLINITAEYLSWSPFRVRSSQMAACYEGILTKVLKLSCRGGRKEAESHTTHFESMKGLYEGDTTVFVPAQQNDLS